MEDAPDDAATVTGEVTLGSVGTGGLPDQELASATVRSDSSWPAARCAAVTWARLVVSSPDWLTKAADIGTRMMSSTAEATITSASVKPSWRDLRRSGPFASLWWPSISCPELLGTERAGEVPA